MKTAKREGKFVKQWVQDEFFYFSYSKACLTQSTLHWLDGL